MISNNISLLQDSLSVIERLEKELAAYRSCPLCVNGWLVVIDIVIKLSILGERKRFQRKVPVADVRTHHAIIWLRAITIR